MANVLFSASTKYTQIGLLILRIGIGLSMAYFHGYPKLIGGVERWEGLGRAMGNIGITFWPVFWGFMAMFTEFFGGILIAIGLLTRPMALLICITMFVAIFQHIAQDRSVAYPLEMLLVFFSIFVMGPGRYSLDYRIR